jgi:hypothetical protein
MPQNRERGERAAKRSTYLRRVPQQWLMMQQTLDVSGSRLTQIGGALAGLEASASARVLSSSGSLEAQASFWEMYCHKGGGCDL